MCFLNIGGNTKPTIKPPYNSCLWLLWNLVELPFRNHIFVKPKILWLRTSTTATGNGTLAVIPKKIRRKREILEKKIIINCF